VLSVHYLELESHEIVTSVSGQTCTGTQLENLRCRGASARNEDVVVAPRLHGRNQGTEPYQEKRKTRSSTTGEERLQPLLGVTLRRHSDGVAVRALEETGVKSCTPPPMDFPLRRNSQWREDESLLEIGPKLHRECRLRCKSLWPLGFAQQRRKRRCRADAAFVRPWYPAASLEFGTVPAARRASSTYSRYACTGPTHI
jgi:hypothetical protein